MTTRVTIADLKIAQPLIDLVADEIAPGTGIDPQQFWTALSDIVSELAPTQRALIAKRDSMQQQLDAWHKDNRDKPHDATAYKAFLTEIGYLLPQPESFSIETAGVDAEIAEIAGPQLVVPVNNARYSLNAANARWGSLFDALYGTDVIPQIDGLEKGMTFNQARGDKVFAYAAAFLDEAAPLQQGEHLQVKRYFLTNTGQTKVLQAELADGSITGLTNPAQCAGYIGADEPEALLLQNNGLHIDIRIDRDDKIGARHPAGVKDIVLESAVTNIQDCEDSVAAVDAADKACVYRNWLGLMQGSLQASFYKKGKETLRSLNADRHYNAAAGGELTLPGRTLLLVRDVGHLMTTPAVLDSNDEEIPETFLDCMMNSFIAMHDLRGTGKYRNSKAGSVYI
ncbi:unnamed protein product, partial [Cyprideis torosa]